MKSAITLLSLMALSSLSYSNDIVYETEWISSKAMEKTLAKMNANRLFPCLVTGRVDGIEIQYKGAYCPFIPNLDHFHSRWGMSDNWYQKYKKKYESEGHLEYFHSTFIDLSGETVHQATWIEVTEEE